MEMGRVMEMVSSSEKDENALKTVRTMFYGAQEEIRNLNKLLKEAKDAKVT